MDLDLFKGINDRKGHGNGDMVISTAAAIILDNLEANDFAAVTVARNLPSFLLKKRQKPVLQFWKKSVWILKQSFLIPCQKRWLR